MEEHDREAELEAALDACESWQDWVRAYVAANPDDDAHDVGTAMALYGFARLGPPLARDEIRALQLELGAAGMTAETLVAEREETAMYARKAEERVLARLAQLRKKLGPTPPWAERKSERLSIDAQAFEQAIELRSGERSGSRPDIPLEHEPLSALTQKVFTELALPAELRDLFIKHSYQLAIGFGELMLERVNRMVFDNLDDENYFVEHGLFQVGTDTSGNALVVDLHTLSVGFVSHENQQEEDVDPRADWMELQLDLGTCLLASAREG